MVTGGAFVTKNILEWINTVSVFFFKNPFVCRIEVIAPRLATLATSDGIPVQPGVIARVCIAAVFQKRTGGRASGAAASGDGHGASLSVAAFRC